MNKVLRQGSYFTIISGIGWCIDFGIYTLLTVYWQVAVAHANMLSSIPAVTFVFLFSTRYIFICSNDGLSLKAKYILYIIYQIVLVYAVSWGVKWIYDALMMYCRGIFGAEILAKCLITPITMVCNFVVMKIMSEKI